MGDSKAFPLPPVTETKSGQPRRIGLELEFIGLGIEAIGRIMRECLGGAISPLSPYEYELEDTEHGTWLIELDYAYLKKVGRGEASGLEDLPTLGGFGDLEKLSEDMLAAVAKQVVPYEIVSPPLPMSAVDVLEPVIGKLREAGAKGTGQSAVYAFGLHFNPEPPALDADTIRRYLQAFCVLFDWLKEASDVDLSRRITPYIKPFPGEYVSKLVDPDYGPDLDELIDDYLKQNATRNRALDMLPLFAHLDERRVQAVVDDNRVKPRPTLHYRLPNCQIEEVGWGIGIAWRHWLQIESLACDAQRLAEACAAYSNYLGSRVDRLLTDWEKTSRQWLDASLLDK